MSELLTEPLLRNALIVAVSISLACAVLSVFIVSRHWAFVGEGIGHSGFGGAGTAWLLAAFVPALDNQVLPYVAVVVFCVLTAFAIGSLADRRGISTDTAVGIFLVASLAWGFIGQQVYATTYGRLPVGFENILFGRQLVVPPAYAVAAVVISSAAILTVWALGKEIVAYTFDPGLARVAGVRTGLIHNTLMVIIAILIALSIPMIGSVLVTALLVLPGAAALQLSRRLVTAISSSVAIALVGAVAGLMLHQTVPAVPTGPAIVLVLFVAFLIAYTYARLTRRA